MRKKHQQPGSANTTKYSLCNDMNIIFIKWQQFQTWFQYLFLSLAPLLLMAFVCVTSSYLAIQLNHSARKDVTTIHHHFFSSFIPIYSIYQSHFSVTRFVCPFVFRVSFAACVPKKKRPGKEGCLFFDFCPAMRWFRFNCIAQNRQ